jgi:trigger factor
VGVTTERLEGSLVALEIEVDDDRLEGAMKKAVNRIAQQVKIPGFRPGKAPRGVVERHVGKGMILQEALDKLVPDAYTEAIQAEELEVIDQPDIEVISTEPLSFKATVAVRPTIALNDYEAIRIPLPETKISDEDREDALTELRRRFAMLEPVDRGIQWSDTIRADVTVDIEGQDEPHVETDAEFSVREGGVVSLPGFIEELIGRERGGPHEITIKLPDEFQVEELQGKTASYIVTIHEVKQELLPDADDEFAKSLEEDFETLDALKERIAADLLEQKEKASYDEYRNEIVDLLVARATLDYPQVMVEREINRFIDVESNHASHTQEGLAQWLSTTGQTIDEVRERLADQADNAVRRALVLGQFSATEEIEVSDDLVNEEMDRLILSMTGDQEAPPEQAQAIRGMIDTPEGRSSIHNQLLTRLVLERMEAISSQPEDESAEVPERGRRRSKRRVAAEDDDALEVVADTSDTPEASGDNAGEEAAEE